MRGAPAAPDAGTTEDFVGIAPGAPTRDGLAADATFAPPAVLYVFGALAPFGDTADFAPAGTEETERGAPATFPAGTTEVFAEIGPGVW